MSRLSLDIGLSAIATGLDQIARGRVEAGSMGIRKGLEYLKTQIAQARS